MKKLIYLTLFVFVFGPNVKAQDIITNVRTSRNISLGEDASITFKVNLLRECDSYSVDFDVSYNRMEVIIRVDYDYDYSCEESRNSDSEEIEFIPLLEGDYDVVIECDVSRNSRLDEKVNDDFDVEEPNEGCYGRAPSSAESCPGGSNAVCACDGRNYSNECEAYFENDRGVYYHFNCGSFLDDNSVKFECGEFTLDEDNTFVDYHCSDGYYTSSELYLKYTHENDGDSLHLTFSSSEPSLRVFLTELTSSGDINCLAVSNEENLKVENLDAGTYYIIADSKTGYHNKVMICDVNGTHDLNKELEISISPVPSHSDFQINSRVNVLRVQISNSIGIEKFNKAYSSKNINVKHNLLPGFYFVKVSTNLGTVTSKIMVE